jgi:1-acyl-sn-glycerol-3-phosphate acyltransferase
MADTRREVAERSQLPVLVPRETEAGPRPDPARPGDVDDWGRSQRFRDVTNKYFIGPMYRHWFRAEWEGLEHIPKTGGALLVANHAGAVPSDDPVIVYGVEQETGRPLYSLADFVFPSIPFIGLVQNRFGGVPAHPENAYRLLREEQQLAIVFPEGTKGTGKPYRQRYQLQRFGRGGFVEIAMRSGVPIIPIAVMGSEEAMPMVARSPRLAKALGVPYAPVTANMLAFGPLLGAFLWFPAKFRLRVLPPVHFDVPPDQERYSKARVLDESEAIRQRIQDAVHDLVSHRKSVWFG